MKHRALRSRDNGHTLRPGQGAMKKKHDHTRTSGRHRRALRMRGRVKA